MAEQKLIITSTDTSGQTVQKTVTGINPEASNEQLATFGQMVNDFTTNNYGKTERVIKMDCDAEAGGGEKPTPELWFIDFNDNRADSQVINKGSSPFVNIHYNGDGAVGYCFDRSATFNGVQFGVLNTSTHEIPATLNAGGAASGTYTLTFVALETDNYKSATCDVTLTIQ